MVRPVAMSLVAVAVLLGASALLAQQGAPVLPAPLGVTQAGYDADCVGCGQKSCSQKGCHVKLCDGRAQKCHGQFYCPHCHGAHHGGCHHGCRLAGQGCCSRCGRLAPYGYLGPANMYEGYQADLFYNFYAPQGSSQGVPTDMYVSPHDTPWPAIQVYYTYQPWLPHEFLYNHHRTYQRYYSGGMGRNTTHVSWGGSPTRRVHEQGIVWGF
jgi:hypothetical protein